MKRIVLIDDKHVDVTRSFTLGFTSDTKMFKMSDVLQFSETQCQQLFSGLTSGDAVMIWGPAGFEFLKGLYHFGIRSENYFDCSLLIRLGMDGGCFARIYHENDDPTPEEIQYFLSPDFTRVRDFSYLQTKIIKTFSEAKPFLEYFYNQPIGTYIGFDYETSGMPMETYFKIAGAALSIHNASAYFSFLDIERNNPELFEEFKRMFAAILEKHQRTIWVFNLQFEQQVTWREFGIECAFRDAGVFNVLDGLHSKNYSLKWTAQRLLGGGDTQTPKCGQVGIHDLGGISPWDTDFDRLEALFDEMYFMEVQNPEIRGKKGLQKVLKISPLSYQETPEWDEICQRYPDYINEFHELIRENFGNQFLNIPSDILGHYCCLDAFYTVQIALESKDRYSQLCVDTFAANMSLGARLHRGGLYVNTEFRDEYDHYCDKMMFWGILYASSFRCKYKMEQHSKKANKLKKYNPVCRLLLNRGEFHNGDIMEITKDILANNVDDNDSTEDGTGLCVGSLYNTYGPEFSDDLIDIVKESMTEVKFKGKIDSSIVRKKKILGVIAEKLKVYLELDKIDLGKKHEELEKFLFFEKGYNECLNLWQAIGDDINNLPDTVIVFGNEMTLDQAANFLMENYYRCTSPVDNSAITEELLSQFGTESVFLASIFKESNKLENDNKFFESIGIKTPQEGYNHFMEHWQIYWNLSDGGRKRFIWPENYICPYPIDLYTTAIAYWSNYLKEDKVADVWEAFDGWDMQSSFFSDHVKSEMPLMKLPYRPEDHNLDKFTQMRKFLVNILLFKKYNKIKTTYINGLFKNNAKYVIDTPNLMPLRDAVSPDEPGAVLKLFPKFEIMKKETKRWSSGFHTIPSHMDLKEAVTTPKGFMMSYFDISSAEIRTLAFRSGDKNLIGLFQKGEDVYIYVAKQHLGEDIWDALGKSDKKKWRKRMKVVFLAIAYRMSPRTLGEQLNIPEDQAQALIDTLFGQFPDLKTFIEYNAAYPEKHEGFINQELGDTLRCSTWRFVNYRDAAGRMRVDKGKLSKVSRAGINYKIQSFSAIALANGFNHVVERSREVGIPMTNIIVVHDSSENLFSVDHVFDIKKYYEKEFMDYCCDLYGIEFKFDLMVSGSGYEGFVELKDAGPGQIEICGSGSNIQSFLRKIDEESNLQVATDIPREDIKPLMMTDAIERFISEHGCCMIKDTSYYNVKLTKLN